MADEELEAPVDFTKLVHASQAVAWLTPMMGSSLNAKNELADRMRDGTLETYAVRIWQTEIRDVTDAWFEAPDEDDDFADVQHNLLVSPWIWRRSRQWINDQAEWRWPGARFGSVVALKPFKRTLVEQVHFKPDDLKKLASTLGTYAEPFVEPPLAGANENEQSAPDPDGTSFQGESKPSKGGRHARGKAWAAVCLELFRLKEAGELTVAHFEKQKTLVGHLEVISERSGAGLKSDAITPLVSELVKSGFVAKGE